MPYVRRHTLKSMVIHDTSQTAYEAKGLNPQEQVLNLKENDGPELSVPGKQKTFNHMYLLLNLISSTLSHAATFISWIPVQ